MRWDKDAPVVVEVSVWDTGAVYVHRCGSELDDNWLLTDPDSHWYGPIPVPTIPITPLPTHHS